MLYGFDCLDEGVGWGHNWWRFLRSSSRSEDVKPNNKPEAHPAAH
jgi:hypothetical protein